MWLLGGWVASLGVDSINMTNKWIRTETNDGIAIITIDRPAALNALNREVLQELSFALEQVEKDESVRVLMLKGGGEKAFIAGADIAEMQDMKPDHAAVFSKLGHAACHRLESMSIPTIALVHGFALGGGTEFALACDFIIASESAVFGLPEVSLGVIPGFGGTFRLASRVGPAMAKELVFSGRRVMAAEALEIRLANRVVAKEALLEEGQKLAKSIAQNSKAAISVAKALIRDVFERESAARADLEALSFGSLFAQYDQREGMKAFAEKRKPKFQ